MDPHARAELATNTETTSRLIDKDLDAMQLFMFAEVSILRPSCPYVSSFLLVWFGSRVVCLFGYFMSWSGLLEMIRKFVLLMFMLGSFIQIVV